MHRHDLQNLVDFNYWARDRVLEAVAGLDAERYTRDLGSSFTSVRDTLVHIYSSEWVWYSRWQGMSPTTRPSTDDFPDVPSLVAAWRSLESQIRAFFHELGEEGMRREIDYRLMNGDPGRSAFWQMLQHVVNHGSYHRGQVTTMLRQMGAPLPKSQDLIAFYRERGHR